MNLHWKLRNDFSQLSFKITFSFYPFYPFYRQLYLLIMTSFQHPLHSNQLLISHHQTQNLHPRSHHLLHHLHLYLSLTVYYPIFHLLLFTRWILFLIHLCILILFFSSQNSPLFVLIQIFLFMWKWSLHS